MKNNIFIIQNISGTSKRVLKRVGAETDRNTLGYVVEVSRYSEKIRDWTKPKIKKFKFFSDALSFVNYGNL